jgi:hypothetical protein
MDAFGNLPVYLMDSLMAGGTIALLGRFALWGSRDWLAHRLATQQANAAKVAAQAQVEQAKAKERAQIAVAQTQAEAQVQIARERAQAAAQTEVQIAQIKAQAMATQHATRLQLAQIEQNRAQFQAAYAPPTVAALITRDEPVAAQIIEQPVLPEMLQWRDVADRAKPGHFVYGVIADGTFITKRITSAYHTLLHGETRSGKTTAIHSLLVQAHHLAHHAQVKCYLSDIKRELGSAWGRSPLLAAPVQNDAQGAGELITELVNGKDGILARYAEFERLGHEQGVICPNIIDYERYTKQRPPLCFVVLDELNSTLELARKGDELQRSLTILLQTGAAAGYYVIAGSQYMSSKVIGRDSSQQFVSRAHFGSPDPTALRMLFGQAPQHVNDSQVVPGRGFIRVQGQPTAVPFQGVYCDEATILGVQQSLRRASTPTPISFDDYHRRAVSPAEKAVEAAEKIVENFPVSTSTSTTPETVSTAFPSDFSTFPPGSQKTEIDPEKADRVASLLAEKNGKIKKGDIIAEVWGVTSGRKYQAASTEYETIMAHLDSGAA